MNRVRDYQRLSFSLGSDSNDCIQPGRDIKHTRSRGAVETFPNVQPYTLERKGFSMKR